uniref:PIPK domain-containing protein n=1 Tax=Kwoniella pini CBS 10737 TaxID=1296096 RepID=A0A1B9IDE0_9TREE|nr:uncharacterized protein I206_00911 [Kwoniella pini CBS 10737]OCF53605.1 hypothetical protein I206_00911 [Kwoniella pini CBS 10737]
MSSPNLPSPTSLPLASASGKPLSRDAYPARPASIPLPPRKNTLGLPPTYLHHLRQLLRQWLDQQTREEEQVGLRRKRKNDPTSCSRLWSEPTVDSLEKAIWEGIVEPSQEEAGRKSQAILKLDWSTWIEGSAERRAVWRQSQQAEITQLALQEAEKVNGITMDTLRGRPSSSKNSLHEIESSGQENSDAFKTFQSLSRKPDTSSSGSSRSPSVASSCRTSAPPPKPLTRHETQRTEASIDVDDDDVQRWCQAISRMDGYRPLSLPKNDEWEVVEDECPSFASIQREVPGAFPQTSSSDYGFSAATGSHLSASSSRARFSNLGLPTPVYLPDHPDIAAVLIKPVICLHFLPLDSPLQRSSSTLNLKREDSLGRNSVSSIGSGGRHKKWWSGSGGRCSEITIGLNTNSTPESAPETEFISGQYALPTDSGRSKPWTQNLQTRPEKKRRSVLTSFATSLESSTSLRQQRSIMPDSNGEQSVKDESNDETGTQKGSPVVIRAGLSFVVAGSDLDIPLPRDGETTKLVGGTIVMRGTRDEEEKRALHRILQYFVYTIQSMFRELQLLDSFRIPREPDILAIPDKSSPSTDSAVRPLWEHRESLEWPRSDASKQKGKHVHRGFFHRLGKDTRHVWEGLLGRRKPSGSHEAPFLPSMPNVPTKDLPVTSPTASFPNLGNASTPTSLVASAAAGFSRNTTTPPPIEKYLTILLSLERQLPSSTPGLTLPMPPLLVRLRREDEVRRAKARQEAEEAKTGRAHVNGLPLANPKPYAPSDLLSVDPLQGRALNYRLGGDVRAGLSALSDDLATFEGWIRLQKLDVLYSVGTDTAADNGEREIHICQPPKPQTYVFWDDGTDRTVQQVINDLQDELAEENMVCPRPGCTATTANHVRWWLHSGKKVVLKVESVDKHDMPDHTLDVWPRCNECRTVGDARELSKGAGNFSWGKLLELLIFTDKLQLPILCSHTEHPSLFIRAPSAVISLHTESISILDTRLPKLQVGPNVNKRKGGKESVEAVMRSLVRKEVEQERIDTLRREIKEAFGALQQRAELLVKSLNDPNLSERYALLSNFIDSSDDYKLSLFGELEESPSSLINDIRTTFAQQIRSHAIDLDECKKDIGLEYVDFTDIPLRLPDYAEGETAFALPSSHVLVKLKEPSSIIAYTFYFNELTNTAENNETASNDAGLSRSSTAPLNPKDEKVVWSTEVKRRDTPRDLLSLRTVAKKKSEIQLSRAHKPPLGLSIASNAPPSLELTLEQVEGRSQSFNRLGDLVKTIGKATAQDPNIQTESLNAPVSIAQAPAESDNDAMLTVRASPRNMRRLNSDENTVRAAPPSAFRPSTPRTISDSFITPLTPTSPRNATGTITSKESWGSVTSTFSNSFNQLLKIGTDVGGSISQMRIKGTDRSLSSLIGPLGMMANADNSLSSMDDRPHLQFTYTFGDHLKLGCTVYYAAAFDSLRRRCAIDRSLIQSLRKTDAWDAQGGKSKAAFFMTHDKRYIVKELVSKWNVSDTHALLDIAPAYFEHLAGTHNKATALAKIVGFYTVRINDMKAGTKKHLDLLVMENLFYKQTISRTYDLKGIEGRRVNKAKVEGELKSEPKLDGTSLDGEWLEGLMKGLVLLQPHAKRILQDAISLDTKFLSSQSVMDYSLLVGVDEGKHELVVGLVDAVGNYNLFKTIESRGKLALNRGGDVTIIPPDKYRERFEHALKHYFIACPDKWSKNSRRGGEKTSIALPSVL